jgi:DNA gyrase subunit A
MSESYTHGTIENVNLVDEMKTAFIDYSMSVITSRALPDVRDGFKPVHRRILYSMYKTGMTPDKPHKKSAHIVGNVLANYHPHGDAAVYDAMVRLAQPFSLRYPLVDGQGNFGNIDGYQAAAMRYTEARMSKLAQEMLRDIDKETVDFMPTYDESSEEPTVLPSRFPNLLVNGSSGIAVGMATNMPPHNLREVTKAVVAMIDDPTVDDDVLMGAIKAPDFPTGGIIMGLGGVREAYKTGRGAITVRARTNIERMQNGKSRIIVTEIPYQVNKARLVEKIADLNKDKTIDGITALRDESNREGIRIVIELRRDVNPQVALNQLFKHTQLQASFNVINLALVDGVPRILNLRQLISYYLDHQENVIVRRTEYDLKKAEERAHIVEGLMIAVNNIDEVVRIIRSSYDDAESKRRLGERFGLSDRQAQAVIEMQLRRLQGLNVEKLEAELADLRARIAEYKAILADENKVKAIIRKELSEIAEKYGDDRMTEISYDDDDINIEDLVADEDVVITISHAGYIKRMPMDAYRPQKRGGRGVTATKMKEADFVENIFITTTHQYIHFFTNKGRLMRLKAFEVPEGSRTGRGTAMINLLRLEEGEKVSAVLPLRSYDDDAFLTFATKDGMVKKTALRDYNTARKDSGILAIKMRPDDELINVELTHEGSELVFVTAHGYAIRFSADEVRPAGRVSMGVHAVRLDAGDRVVAMDVVRPEGELLVISENGYGKRTAISEYRTQARGGKGIRTMALSPQTGNIAAAMMVRAGQELMVISTGGTLIRTKVDEIGVHGRATRGVRIMKLADEERVIDIARIAEEPAK